MVVVVNKNLKKFINKIMKKYNKANKCVKCGCKNIKTEYIDNKKPIKLNDGTIVPVPRIFYEKIEEYIERTCSNCGYIWNEEPLDKK